MRLPIAALTAALVTAPPVMAQAHSEAPSPIGSRVRVWTTGTTHLVGYLVELRGDTMVIEAPGASRAQTRLLTNSTIALDVSEGRVFSPRNVAVGALGGAALLVGVVAVLDIGVVESTCTVGGECGGTKNTVYLGAAAIGGGVGAFFGAFTLADRWRRVPVPGRVGLAPIGRRQALAVSFAFR